VRRRQGGRGRGRGRPWRRCERGTRRWLVYSSRPLRLQMPHAWASLGRAS
jgi:hypothetical protein